VLEIGFVLVLTLLAKDCTATASPRYCWDATMYNARLGRLRRRVGRDY
jgi:hypothetical protein